MFDLAANPKLQLLADMKLHLVRNLARANLPHVRAAMRYLSNLCAYNKARYPNSVGEVGNAVGPYVV
jgi:hypothetical protein